MSLKVREILELAETKGCSLAAGKGGLDRVVRFVDCMEIPDMKAWMRPNVFYITTGYTYSNSEEEIIQLIRDLYDAKAAALATKYKYIGCSLDAAIKVADELQFPLILWPEDLPFIEMNYLVMEALIKSQNNLMDSMQSQIKRYNQREMDQRLFVDLLTGNIAHDEEENYRIKEQRWPVPPYQIIYIEVDRIKQKLHELREEEAQERIEKIENLIREALTGEQVVVLSNNGTFQCILKRTGDKEIGADYFEAIQREICEKTGYRATIGVSRAEDTYKRFGQAYQDARDAVEIAVCQNLESRVLCIEDAGFWKILKKISKQDMCREFVEEKLNAFIEYDQENERELLETLEALVNNLGARNVTANALHLHRNTLMYRIKKIENQTGYDLSDPNSILELAFALRIMKFMK